VIYTMRIITGTSEYRKVLLECQKNVPIWKLGVETVRQLESEQYLQMKGFGKVK